MAGSTLTVDWTRTLADAIANRGAAFLEAPAVGSGSQIEAGKLIFLAGGQAETLAQVRDILTSAGIATIHYVVWVKQVRVFFP